MEIWRCIWNRSREVPDPLTQSFFGEKILKRRKTRQSDRITFSSRSRLFFKFSFLFSSSLITPTWLIQQTLWYNVIKGDLQRLRESLIKKKMKAVIEQFLKALACDWIWIFIRKNLLLLYKFFLKLPFKHIFWHGIPKYFVFLLRTHVFRSITINAQQREWTIYDITVDISFKFNRRILLYREKIFFNTDPLMSTNTIYLYFTIRLWKIRPEKR